MNNNTIDIETITNKKIDYEALAGAVKQGFEKHFNIGFREFTAQTKEEEISKLLAEKDNLL